VAVAERQGKGRSSFLKKRSKRLLIFQVFVPPGRSATASKKGLFVPIAATVSERHHGLV
jgi:hypothetical protein